MNYTITKDSGVPAYIQLYNYLVQDIVAGIYPLDSRLPSKRIIAEETGVSLITVEHTMNLLSDEGYIETRQRSGYVDGCKSIASDTFSHEYSVCNNEYS